MIKFIFITLGVIAVFLMSHHIEWFRSPAFVLMNVPFSWGIVSIAAVIVVGAFKL